MLLLFLLLALLIGTCRFVEADDSLTRCISAAKHLAATSREMRTLYIPSIEHADAGKTITGRRGCLVTMTGWWTYEFCFGDYIRQFHSENGVIHDEYFIGVSGNVFDKTSAANSKLKFKNGEASLASRIKSVAQDLDGSAEHYKFLCNADLSALLTDKAEGVVVFTQYDSGSYCEAAKKRRSATVFFICDSTPVSKDPSKRMPIFFDIVETSPCTYQVFVKGDSMCSMMNRLVPSSAESPASTATREKDAAKASEPKRSEPATRSDSVMEPPKGISVRNDASLDEAFEELPAKSGDEGSVKNHKKCAAYSQGLDDPKFFDDSFIMSI